MLSQYFNMFLVINELFSSVTGHPRACVWVRRLTLAMSPDRFKLCRQSLVMCIALHA